ITFYGDGSQVGTDSVSGGSRAHATWTGVSDSTHDWYVKGCNSGDCSTSSTWSFGVDTTNPSASASHSPSSPNTSEEVSVKGEGSDATSGVWQIRVYVDGTLQSTCSASPCYYNNTYTTAGTYSYTVEVEDMANNTNSASGSFTVNDPPSAPSNPDPSDGGIVATSSVSLSALYDDPNGDSGTLTYYFGNNDTTIGSCSVSDGNRCSVTLGDLSDGQHSWYAVADDGGKSTTGSTWTFTSDTTNPSATASHSPSSPNTSEEVSVKGEGS
ncbi:MAG: hypothetical protein ABEK12_03725, partial [Candidatus Nanohaloarchaea archaeon]